MPEDDITIDCDLCERSFTGPTSGRGNVHWRKANHLRQTHGVTNEDAPPPRERPSNGAPKEGVKVDVNLGFAAKGKSSGDPALEAVRQRAEQVATVMAVGLFLIGQEADGADIERGKAQWALSVRDLAVHEEWLRKLCQGGEASERVMAWIKFAAATLGLTLPILLRHGAIPPTLARVFAMAEGQLPTEPGPPADAPADEPLLHPVA